MAHEEGPGAPAWGAPGAARALAERRRTPTRPIATRPLSSVVNEELARGRPTRAISASRNAVRAGVGTGIGLCSAMRLLPEGQRSCDCSSAGSPPSSTPPTAWPTCRTLSADACAFRVRLRVLRARCNAP